MLAPEKRCHCEEAEADEAIQRTIFWIATPLSRLAMTPFFFSSQTAYLC
jgi:hypothetical protein